MSEHRPTNSELKLQQLEEQEQREHQASEEKGIFELFDEPKDEDEPLARETGR